MCAFTFRDAPPILWGGRRIRTFRRELRPNGEIPMNDWQRSFLPRLEKAKKQWLHNFERFAAKHLEPVFHGFDEFAAAHGFSVTAPPCESGTRLFKFGLTENGYMLITYRMHGLESVEVCAEVFVPGPEEAEPLCDRAKLCDADRSWVREQFEHALDRFIVAFGAAGAVDAGQKEELITA